MASVNRASMQKALDWPPERWPAVVQGVEVARAVAWIVSASTISASGRWTSLAEFGAE